MYWLISFDAVVRIAFAIAFFFIIVPSLARLRAPANTFLDRFFWNFGVGLAVLTIAGQLLTLGNLFSLLTLLLACGAVVVIVRARAVGMGPWMFVRRGAENAFLAFLNIFDRRVSLLRRARRRYRRTVRVLRERTASRAAKLQIAAWTALVAVAAAFRLYRPLASANLGFSDTYVHLYLLKLLEEGRQVDPAFGPYPRGMHFLLMAIHDLTNVDQILLMNFFGAVVGVIITLAVAQTARRASGSLAGGLLAGFLFATFVGGPSQYFVVGGAFGTEDGSLARTLRALPYRDLTETAGEFDIALTAFHRQTSTLSQELAIALLFPAALFLLDWFRKRERWHLVGFAGCTAAIAAVHSGVVIPLILMSAVALLAVLIARESDVRVTARRAITAGAFAVLIGSAWTLAFIAYPYAGGKSHTSGETSVASAVLYYFPFLRTLANGETTAVPVQDLPVYVTLTPFLIVCIILALGLIASAFLRRDDLSAYRFWTASVFLMFLLIHFSSMLRLPRIIETTRNSQWLMMSILVVVGVAVVEIVSILPTQRYALATTMCVVPVAVFWMLRVPLPSERAIHERIVNYSGYGGTALAVLRIERSLEPYTWTLVSYGQEFPMVLRRGFHVPAGDFLDRYDPTVDVVPIPTPHVFVVVEKTPHEFQINTWAQRFSRTELEQRLQTWIHLYQATHTNLRVFLEDEDVRVYQIERTQEEVERAALQARR